MTGPMPQLPSIQLGNTASDIGSGVNTFIQGLMGQRQRQAQLQMQQSLAAGRTQLEQAQAGQAQAQTGDIAAQAAQRQQENLPADDNDEALLRQALGPNGAQVPKGIYQGVTKGQAQQYTKILGTTHMLGMRLGMTGSNQVLTRFNAQSKNEVQAKQYYDNVMGMLNSNSSIAPIEILGSLSQLAVPGNARAVGTMLTAMKSGSPLGGPFTAYENIFNTLGKVFNTQGMTLDSNARQEVIKAANALVRNHMNNYDRILRTHMSQAGTMGTPLGPDDFGEDPFASIRSDVLGGNRSGGQAQPQGWSPNPRFGGP